MCVFGGGMLKCVCTQYTMKMLVKARRGRHLLELGSQAAVNCQMWVLVTNPCSSARAANSLNQQTFSKFSY